MPENVEPDAKPDAKPEVRPDAEPEVKPDARPGAKLDAKPDAKPGAEPKRSAAPAYDFAAINAQIGARLQLIVDRNAQRQNYFATLIGCVDGEAVLIRTPSEGGRPVLFQEGEPLTVRIFSGVQVFSFATSVDRILVSPCPCLCLAFPRKVNGSPLRKAMRVKVQLPAQVVRTPAGEAPVSAPATLTNLSVIGGLAESETKLGAVKEEIEISFEFVVNPGEREVKLKSRAVIRNVKEPKTESPSKPGVFAHGIEFVDLDPNDQLMLQILVYEAIVAGRQALM